jgi:hypothetical protein
MNDILSKTIEAIKRSRAAYAQGALENPKADNPAFEYGRACGVIQGLNEALRLVEELLQPKEEDHGRSRRDR